MASSQPNEVFSQSERASVPRHAINQTDIDASVRIHKNTHVSVQRSHDRPSFTVFDAVGVAISVMTSFIPSDNAKSLISVLMVLDRQYLLF